MARPAPIAAAISTARAGTSILRFTAALPFLVAVSDRARLTALRPARGASFRGRYHRSTTPQHDAPAPSHGRHVKRPGAVAACRRTAPGGTPVTRLNARAKAASER